MDPFELERAIKKTRARMDKTGEDAFTAACTVVLKLKTTTMTPAAIAWAAENPQPEGEPIFPLPKPMAEPPLNSGKPKA